MNTAQTPDWLPSFLVPFFSLSYPSPPPASPDSFPNSSYYGVGLLDGCLIITCIAVMAILRDALRLGVFEPFARWWLTRELKQQKRLENGVANTIVNEKANGKANGGVKDYGSVSKTNGAANGNGVPSEVIITKAEARKLHRSVLRFAEQGWSVVYYTCQWLFGLYIHCNLPTRLLNPIDVWINYPHIPLAGPLKSYYLTQSAFYLHQMLILNAEARRKDHWQMMTHHVITVILMISSYFYNFTRVGCLIMMLMDLCDIFLPLAKMLRYLGFTTLCDATFVVFMISWLVTRHFLFVFVIKSSVYDAARIIAPVWEPETGHFMTEDVLLAFNIMLVSLQVIQLVWFWMICRVAYRVVMGENAEDSRSDEEGGFSEDEDEKKDR